MSVKGNQGCWACVFVHITQVIKKKNQFLSSILGAIDANGT